MLPFFLNEVSLKDYIVLDDIVLMYYFSIWQEEEDPILSDLCSRFLNRRLLRYINYDPKEDAELYAELKDFLKRPILIRLII